MRPVAWIVVVDAACVLFALWTVLCHGVVLARGDSYALAYGCLSLSALTLAAAGWYTARCGGAGWRRWFEDPTLPAPVTSRRVPNLPRWWPLVGLLGLVVVRGLTANWIWPWLVALLYFSGWYAFLLWRKADDWPWGVGLTDRPSHTWVLLGLGALCAVVALVANRPDIDDARYINMAVGVADLPHQPVLFFDTLRADKTEFWPPYYRIHSVELLVGLVAWLTGAEPLWIAHLGLAAGAALLLPLALARLARELCADAFIWVVVAVLALYVMDGSAHRAYANFAMVRLFQGKAILLSVCAPLILAYGLRFGRSPSWRGFVQLACAQIAALGLSSTALWLAPVLAALGVGAALGFRDLRCTLRGVALTILSSGYVVITGLLLIVSYPGRSLSGGGVAELDSLRGSIASVGRSVELAVGPAGSQIMLVGAWLLACSLATGEAGRRLFALSGLLVTGILGNPFLTSIVTKFTGVATYWRIMWVAPLPLALGVCLAALVRPERGWRARVSNAVLATSVATLLWFVPTTHVLSRANHVRIIAPRIKVPQRLARTVEAVRNRVRPGAVFLGPAEVSVWLPTFRRAPLPLMTRDAYFPGPPTELERVERLQRQVSVRARRPFERDFFVDLERYGVRALMLRRPAVSAVRIAQLRCAGFHKDTDIDVFELWLASAALFLDCASESRTPSALGRDLADDVANPPLMSPLEASRRAWSAGHGASHRGSWWTTPESGHGAEDSAGQVRAAGGRDQAVGRVGAPWGKLP